MASPKRKKRQFLISQFLIKFIIFIKNLPQLRPVYLTAKKGSAVRPDKKMFSLIDELSFGEIVNIISSIRAFEAQIFFVFF